MKISVVKLLALCICLVSGEEESSPCNSTEFACGKPSDYCIPLEWECDNYADCEDGSDEKSCPCNGYTCPEDNFCLPDGWVCDGDQDCESGSDEKNCPVTECNGLTCPESSRCLPANWKCDGENDCLDGSDEEDCPATECSGFVCQESNKCLSNWWVCDGEDDCGDGSDETESACPCTEEEKRCSPYPEDSKAPGFCYSKKYDCDEIWDCPNGDDEANCPDSSNDTRHVPPVKSHRNQPRHHQKQDKFKGVYNAEKAAWRKEERTKKERKQATLFAYYKHRSNKGKN